ncbi:MAG TPA: 5-methyltetrahydropteroyltriglutamate--homocysteine S-methyltransferase [Xanthobacteraceae bacterium]|nr:5-methyltetrahydropteroyltriglutamate--homocysteine S-methyltransferase [Xanthobacteraceae bacterium]
MALPLEAARPAPRPPFRADQVGSLLRPQKLKLARERLLGAQTADRHLGPHDDGELRAIEDDCIRAAVAMQERVGLKAVTDGEFRRRSWWLELIMNWDGFAADRAGTTEMAWRNASGAQQAASRLWITGPIRWRASPIVRALAFLKANTTRVPKVTIPAPVTLHMFAGGDKGVREGGHYKDAADFWNDVVAAYRQEVAALAAAGATYIQFDDVSFALLCDPAHRATVARWGNDPDRLVEEYAARINQAIAALPRGVTVTLHQCRGNREGNWMAEGGYEPVADVLFNQIDVHGYFLEYDTARAGSFAPLRLLPRGKTVVLGLVSSKDGRLESADGLKRRIEEAAHFAPIEQLALSPQCGFASSIKGNPLTEADQEAKLARVVAVARDVWGDV